MASASNILEDIDDTFCQCCLCFEQYKDPRQLPCLHRYCANCLQKLINKTEGDIKCPLCQEPVDVPENGAEGLRKDFYMNEMIDYLEVKKSLKDDQLHTCGDCSRTVQASAYCFKCSDFLCNDCHEYHLTRKSLKEHKAHLLSLKDVESKNISLQQLSSLKEAPRCKEHPDNVSHLCCTTCSNLPICVACTYGDHENHKIKDVKSFAKSEKERLQQRLVPLIAYKESIQGAIEKMKFVEMEVRSNAEKHKKDLKETYKRKMSQYEARLNDTQGKRGKEESENRREETKFCLMKDDEMDEKIRLIKIDIEKEKEAKRRETERRIQVLVERYTKQEEQIKNERDGLTANFKTKSDKIDQEETEKIIKSDEISQHLTNTIGRYQNITSTSSNILVSTNNWTVVQNIENICSATEPLLQDMKREFAQMDQIPKYGNVTLSGMRGRRNVRLAQQVERTVDIEGIAAKGWRIFGITGNGDIVISGGAEDKQSFITVITIEGKLVKQQLIKPERRVGSFFICYCASSNESKVVTACYPAEVGLFDVRDQSYYKKNLRDVIHGWPPGRVVRCITTDETNNHVIVGCSDRNVYVLDDQLNHCSTIKLPGMIRWPRDLTVSDGHLIVCDMDRNRACELDMKGELQHEFTKPGIKACDKPISVCTDGSGLIYILWVDRGWDPCDQNCVVAQYCQDDHRILSTTSMYTDALCITIAEIDQTEKLLVATINSGKLHVYDLEDADQGSIETSYHAMFSVRRERSTGDL